MVENEKPPDVPPNVSATVAAIQARMQAVELPAWPVYGLAGNELGWLCGLGENSVSGIEVVRIDYRPPGASTRLIVQSMRAQDQMADRLGVLDQLVADEDDGEPLN